LLVFATVFTGFFHCPGKNSFLPWQKPNPDFNQILQNDRDQQVVIVGGPNTRPANSRWRTAVILKTVKSPYLGNRLTDFDEIWQNDA